ncbi:hypothetical protein KY342_06470 [Candidatus Woesearchaeota archaeon]|nr:hypothetical protein [Candidatus Woesearchaeota archaeon]
MKQIRYSLISDEDRIPLSEESKKNIEKLILEYSNKKTYKINKEKRRKLYDEKRNLDDSIKDITKKIIEIFPKYPNHIVHYSFGYGKSEKKEKELWDQYYDLEIRSLRLEKRIYYKDIKIEENDKINFAKELVKISDFDHDIFERDKKDRIEGLKEINSLIILFKKMKREELRFNPSKLNSIMYYIHRSEQYPLEHPFFPSDYKLKEKLESFFGNK